VDKLNELLLAAVATIGGISAFIIRRLFRSVDKAHARIIILEKTLVDRTYLESQLAPIRSDLNLILKHLLEHRATEANKLKIIDAPVPKIK